MKENNSRQETLRVRLQQLGVKHLGAEADEQWNKSDGKVHEAAQPCRLHGSFLRAGGHHALEHILRCDGSQAYRYPCCKVFHPRGETILREKIKEAFGRL